MGLYTPVAAAITQVITGFSSSVGALAATDTILQAVNKLDGNLTLKAPIASPTFTGLTTASQSLAVTGSQTITALATPVAPTGTPSVTGGTIAASVTNYATVSALDSTGASLGTESLAVTTTGTTSSIAWAWTAVAGATSYRLWVSQTQGVYSRYFASATNSFTQTAPASTGTAGTIVAGNSTGQFSVGSSTVGFTTRPWTAGAFAAIYSNSIVPTDTNYTLVSNSSTTILNASTIVDLKLNNVSVLNVQGGIATVTGTLSRSGLDRSTSKEVDTTASLTAKTLTKARTYLTGIAGASMEMTFPAATAGINGQIMSFTSVAQRVTATYISTGATFVGAPATILALTPVTFQYNHADTTWYLTT